ncbi:hypothetical protein BDV96DRAFT_361477 [Lophiotrema nucula]|uniref:F-box domain-containing protein n=1 Tax=Lophiotrema nucula TaxID=690887 RepID=A0A6A5ZIM5_9PLEO|nr:hypothetical protein BDV96DRAFT_361477 [Lophiotrema nucula]
MSPYFPFQALPTELKSAVFGFVHCKRDRGVARLVCRLWDELMCPHMWRELKVKVDENISNRMSTLLKQKKSILPHVQDVSIFYQDGCESHNVTFAPLFAGLCQDKLTDFFTMAPIKSSDFLLLLSNQVQIKEMSVLVDFSDLSPDSSSKNWFTAHASTITKALSRVEGLEINLSTSKTSEYEVQCQHAKAFIENSPRLKSVSLLADITSTRGVLALEDTFGTMHNGVAPLGNVTTLDLRDLDLWFLKNFPLQGFDLSSLQQLGITYFWHPTILLQHLAKHFQRSGSRLQHLQVALGFDSDEEGALEALEAVYSRSRACKHCGSIADLTEDLS